MANDSDPNYVMRIVGVIDLRQGRAVHARGGQRAEYAPVVQAAGVRVDGDPIALARAYLDTIGVRELYVADLDAIERGVEGLDIDVIASLAALGGPVWVDAGTSTADAAARVLAAGASVVVVGLETLSTFDALAEICSVVGGDRVAFSVDLRDGAAIAAPNALHSGSSAEAVAERAAAAGAGRLIVLDLARVGTGVGVDVVLMARIRRVAPGVQLLAGGGVRDASDLEMLSALGCDGALVATALINGTLHL